MQAAGGQVEHDATLGVEYGLVSGVQVVAPAAELGQKQGVVDPGEGPDRGPHLLGQTAFAVEPQLLDLLQHPVQQPQSPLRQSPGKAGSLGQPGALGDLEAGRRDPEARDHAADLSRRIVAAPVGARS